jgi:glutamate/tyrosine decarboxylase-like PLP-dependent enzyme
MKEPSRREVPLEIPADEFRRLGHRLVDRVAELLDGIRERPVTRGESPGEIRRALGQGRLPEQGEAPGRVLDEAAELLIEHSLYNGHPRFWGYITAPAAPIGVLGDLLAAAINPNMGAWSLSPMASEIEAQTVRWIAELVGYPVSCGGLLVSGGNVANLVGFLAGRRARTPWDLRAQGVRPDAAPRLRVYISAAGHTWIQKAADVSGLGTESIRWIDVDDRERMRPEALAARIRADREAGDRPVVVVGTAGSVGTGAVDPLEEIAAIADAEGAWFHVDGAYGGLAAAYPGAPAELRALARADSLAVDPHKWLYAPLEAGCALVRDPEALDAAFHFAPSYYEFDAEAAVNYFSWGLQNSRSFRALKVWLALRQAGRTGYARMIGDDVALAATLFERVRAEPELEARTLSLSIATFRYVPEDLAAGGAPVQAYLDQLNGELLTALQAGGEAYVSNAVVSGNYLLRACIVNFRTTRDDVMALPGIVVRIGRELDAKLRPEDLRRGP